RECAEHPSSAIRASGRSVRVMGNPCCESYRCSVNPLPGQSGHVQVWFAPMGRNRQKRAKTCRIGLETVTFASKATISGTDVEAFPYLPICTHPADRPFP